MSGRSIYNENNDGWRTIGTQAYANTRFLYYINEIRSAVLIIPDASHCDLYDGGYTELEGKGEPKNLIPWDKLADFFTKNLK